MASFAAAPGEAGWSMPLVYYHTSGDAGGSKNFAIGGNLVAGIDVSANLVFFAPTYTWADPVLGGQAAFSLVWAAGQMQVGVDAVSPAPEATRSTAVVPTRWRVEAISIRSQR